MRWPAPSERTAPRIAALAEGSVGHQLWTDLVVEPNDLTIVKTKYSAFIQLRPARADAPPARDRYAARDRDSDGRVLREHGP